MRHRVTVKPLLVLPLLGLVLAAGCNTPKHSNVLIFATNTKFAIDIGYDPKMQEPSLTVGYKRQEGVWMPLLANTGKEGLEPGPIMVKGDVGTTTGALSADGLLYRGNEGDRKDTYSVLASFGAKWGAKGGTTAESSGGLAQFFATGLAARELAGSGGAQLVSVQPANTVTPEIKRLATKQLVEDKKDADKVMAAVQKADGTIDTDKLAELLKGSAPAGQEKAIADSYKTKAPTDLRKDLDGKLRGMLRGMAIKASKPQ